MLSIHCTDTVWKIPFIPKCLLNFFPFRLRVWNLKRNKVSLLFFFSILCFRLTTVVEMRAVVILKMETTRTLLLLPLIPQYQLLSSPHKPLGEFQELNESICLDLKQVWNRHVLCCRESLRRLDLLPNQYKRMTMISLANMLLWK